MPFEIGSGTFRHERRGEAKQFTPGKKRYIPFYENAGALIASGMPVEQAALEAGKLMHWSSSRYGTEMTDEQVRKKALKILQRPDAPAQLGKFFKKAADFDAVDMAQTAVKFIRGEMTHTRTVVDKEGVEHQITDNLPPSEGMLKAVMGAVLPRQVKQVQIDQRMQIMRLGSAGQEPPKLAARQLETIEGDVAD